MHLSPREATGIVAVDWLESLSADSGWPGWIGYSGEVKRLSHSQTAQRFPGVKHGGVTENKQEPRYKATLQMTPFHRQQTSILGLISILPRIGMNGWYDLRQYMNKWIYNKLTQQLLLLLWGHEWQWVVFTDVDCGEHGWLFSTLLTGSHLEVTQTDAHTHTQAKTQTETHTYPHTHT